MTKEQVMQQSNPMPLKMASDQAGPRTEILASLCFSSNPAVYRFRWSHSNSGTCGTIRLRSMCYLEVSPGKVCKGLQQGIPCSFATPDRPFNFSKLIKQIRNGVRPWVLWKSTSINKDQAIISKLVLSAPFAAIYSMACLPVNYLWRVVHFYELELYLKWVAKGIVWTYSSLQITCNLVTESIVWALVIPRQNMTHL